MYIYLNRQCMSECEQGEKIGGWELMSQRAQAPGPASQPNDHRTHLKAKLIARLGLPARTRTRERAQISPICAPPADRTEGTVPVH